MKPLLLVVLLLSLGLASSKEVFINSTAIAECSTEYECWFFNSSLWVNETIPAENDAVIISDLLPGYSLFLNGSFSLASLEILSPFRLLISPNANVSFVNITLWDSVHIDVSQQAQVYALGFTHVHNGSALSINGGM